MTAGGALQRLRAAAAVAMAAGLCACTASPPEILLAGETMGSQWTVKIAGSLPMPEEQLRLQIQQRFDAVDAALSTWRSDSALTRFNDHPDADWQPVDPELAAVLTYALQLAAQSHGAYDVTLGPVVDLWGFGPAPKRNTAPTREQIEAARQRVGWERIVIDFAGARGRKPPEVRADLSSLGKGRGVDAAAEFLLSRGVENFLIDLSGKLRAHGRSSRGGPWQVAVEQPGADDPSGGKRTVDAPVSLTDTAIASAGTYRRYFETEGRHYSHLIDARTGEPVTHATASATVLATDALRADALATLLVVLPPEEAMAFAEEQGLAALLLMSDGSPALASRAWRSR